MDRIPKTHDVAQHHEHCDRARTYDLRVNGVGYFELQVEVDESAA
ncbi:MAG TPA: hypothetical protein VK761_08645 [Solirubrobacteraceae bacterium]|nr:hypothetical protein [Solirubrobacteraceae bacterium]